MNEKIEKKGLLDRMLDSIERAGNRLPDPITMFLGLAIIVAVISAICSAAGINAVNPADGSTIEIFNLLSFDGIRYLWTNVITQLCWFRTSWNGTGSSDRFLCCRKERISGICYG